MGEYCQRKGPAERAALSHPAQSAWVWVGVALSIFNRGWDPAVAQHGVGRLQYGFPQGKVPQFVSITFDDNFGLAAPGAVGGVRAVVKYFAGKRNPESNGLGYVGLSIGANPNQHLRAKKNGPNKVMPEAALKKSGNQGSVTGLMQRSSDAWRARPYYPRTGRGRYIPARARLGRF